MARQGRVQRWLQAVRVRLPSARVMLGLALAVVIVWNGTPLRSIMPAR